MNLRIAQVVMNVLKNAAKFTSRGGHVRLSTERSSDHRAVIRVVDTGIDANHPDVAGKITAAENFSDEPDVVDRHEVLRTLLIDCDGVGMQRILAPGTHRVPLESKYLEAYLQPNVDIVDVKAAIAVAMIRSPNTSPHAPKLWLEVRIIGPRS